MKPHIPWRTVETNPFNKDMFKGHQEKINDWDLDTTLYVYEPQSLADLGDEASELEYQKVWNKFNAGGHINIYLVPYREMPTVKVEVTSVGASYDGLDKDETVAAYTNVPMGDRPTKRFYSFKPLTESVEPIIDLEIFEENNLTEVINNDSTFKQTTFTLNKFQVYDGGEDSYYRDVRFFYGVFKPENISYIQVESDKPSVIGGIITKGLRGENVVKELEVAIDDSGFVGEVIEQKDPYYKYSSEWLGSTTEVEQTYEYKTEIPTTFLDNVRWENGKNETCWTDPATGFTFHIEHITLNYHIVDANTVRLDYKYKAGFNSECEAVYEGDSNYQPNLHFEFVFKDVVLNDIEVSFGYLEEGSQTIEYSSNNQLYPHMIVPKETESGLVMYTPWTWEYMYANEQFNGKNSIAFVADGQTFDKSPSEESSSWVNLTGEFLFESIEPSYIELFDEEITGAGKELPFFLPYIVEFGLPRGISSHGTVYVNSNDTEGGSGFLNLQYSDSTHNGARAVQTKSGPWSTKSTMFGLDLAYDPTILSIGGNLNIFLSEITYGAFYKSDDYLDLIINVIEENPIYDGTSFNSELGVLQNIEGRDVQRDVRNWSIDNDWNIGLLPLDIIQLSDGYLDNPTFLDSKVTVGQSNPKIDTGLIDFNPAILRTNTTTPFFGKFIDEEKIVDYHNNVKNIGRKLLMKTKKNNVSQIMFNYYAFDSGNIKVKLYSGENGELIELISTTYLNERAQGRNLSGGTIVTWI